MKMKTRQTAEFGALIVTAFDSAAQCSTGNTPGPLPCVRIRSDAPADAGEHGRALL